MLCMYIHNTKVNILQTVSYFKLCEYVAMCIYNAPINVSPAEGEGQAPPKDLTSSNVLEKIPLSLFSPLLQNPFVMIAPLPLHV